MAFDWSQWTPPSGMGAASTSAYWGAHIGSITEARQKYYQDTFYTPESTLRGQYTPWTAPSWTGSSAWTKYSDYQSGMEGLLARIGAGPQSSDIADSQAAVAQMYGYSPASWTAIQQSIPDLLNASNVMAKAGNIATDMQNSAFGQQQQQAMRVAERQATEAVGKQLESIFGARGGLAGFQAAYDLTSQIQNTFVQQAAQNSLAMFDRAVSAVNAENGYYQQLIQNGAIQAQDYLKFRWDSLQTAYGDYMAAMDQTLKEWQVQTNVSQQEYQATQDNITRQIQALDSQLASEMGFDDNQMTIITTAIADAAKSKDTPSETQSNISDGLKGLGSALIAAGAYSGGAMWPLAVAGGALYLIGWLVGG